MYNVEWIYNTKALRHFCSNKELIQDFKDVTDGECVYMGNSTIVRVMSKEKILLKFTPAKLLFLSNVLYMSSLCRLLVSSILVHKVGLKIVVGDEKVVITHN